jgi:hypothetical protein
MYSQPFIFFITDEWAQEVSVCPRETFILEPNGLIYMIKEKEMF